MPISGSTAAEIFDSIRALQQRGELTQGQALPTVRELAAALGVNRNTVSMAYKRLAAAGIAITQGRLGTVIRHPPSAGEQEGFVAGSPLEVPNDLVRLSVGIENVEDLIDDLGSALAQSPAPLVGWTAADH